MDDAGWTWDDNCRIGVVPAWELMIPFGVLCIYLKSFTVKIIIPYLVFLWLGYQNTIFNICFDIYVTGTSQPNIPFDLLHLHTPSQSACIFPLGLDQTPLIRSQYLPHYLEAATWEGDVDKVVWLVRNLTPAWSLKSMFILE